MEWIDISDTRGLPDLNDPEQWIDSEHIFDCFGVMVVYESNGTEYAEFCTSMSMIKSEKRYSNFRVDGGGLLGFFEVKKYMPIEP